MAQPDLLAVFYDGECPICRETIRRIKAKDRAGRIEAVDIKAPAFDRKRWGLPAEADLDGSIHALTQDGRVVAGMEVLRRVYAAVGRGWMLSWTRLPVARGLADRGYRWFAKNRYKIAGRRGGTCEQGSCEVKSE